MKKWFQDLSITRKQLICLITAGLVPMLLVSVICFSVAKQQLKQQAFSQLESVRQIKSSAIERYAEQVESQLITLASSSGTIDAMGAMGRSFNRTVNAEGLDDSDLAKFKRSLQQYYDGGFAVEYAKRNDRSINIDPLMENLDETTIALQYFYIADNTYPLGNKHLLDQAEGRSVYHRNHDQYHPNFRNFLEKFGYYDIFLVDAESGNIVYSVFKELDFATSLLTGPYRNTNFAEAFKKARELSAGQIALEDYASYTPSYDSPASFAATPIVRDGRTIGVLIFQLPLEPINAIMSERAGMGETGESYLVGPDGLMRSDSYLDPKNHSVLASFNNPELGRVDTDAVKAIQRGKSGNEIIIDYNGNAVLSSFAPLKFGPLNWGILAEIDESEAFSGISTLAWSVTALFIIVAIALVSSALMISKLIAGPILRLSRHIEDVQRSGDFSRKLNISQLDEIGQTSRAFNRLQDNLAGALNNVNSTLQELGKGNSSQKITSYYAGDLGTLTNGVNQAAKQIHEAQQAQQAQAEIAKEKAQEAAEAARIAEQQAQETLVIKQALDVCDTSVMIADADLKIIYLNEAIVTLMKASEASIKASIPSFSANTLSGSSVDRCHPNPAHQRSLLAGLTGSHNSQIVISDLTFDLTATPIKDADGSRLGTVIEWKDLTEQLTKQAKERADAQENLRIRQALDNSSTCTMIADKDLNIIYFNKALTALMSNAEAGIRQHLGQFDSHNLMGKNIDIFHRNPAHQRQLLAQINNTLRSEFEAGDRTLAITANPIIDEEGERAGTVVEWLDRTEEVAVEKEIAAIITAASNGDFNHRMNMAGKSGFYKKIGEGLNSIMEQTHTAVSDLVRLFSALSEGDLTQTIQREYAGDFARLKADANKTVDNLREVIDKIQNASTLIARAADEITSGTQDLSSRTEEQASSLEQTASSIEEITQIVRQSEDNAVQANQLSSRATKIAREGDQSVEQTSAAMSAIAESSNKIANIIGVIDEIAFQTNLLALNAAVEAARAGEQGRGFAVVAGEVRNLAQRSATAAKEIKTLIDDSVGKVENGTELVSSSRSALATIVSEIDKVSQMMDAISDSAREQTSGIEQVNSAVAQMDQMTQQNAALVEQASAASASMAEQAGSLQSMVQFFRRG